MIPIPIAVVGAGAAGCFIAEFLLEKLTDRGFAPHIDIFNAALRPGGLIDYGVAPHHFKTRQGMHQGLYERLWNDERVNYYGGVTIGEDDGAVSLNDLRNYYHIVVVAIGAQSDRRLNIPGESSLGCFSASEVVGWYNGDPRFVDVMPDLSGDGRLRHWRRECSA